MAALHLADLWSSVQRRSAQAIQNVHLAAMFEEDVHDVPISFVGGDMKGREKRFVLII